MSRAADLARLYDALERLAALTEGPRSLNAVDGRSGWPRQGIYFFFEPGEHRSQGKPRVTRVGTHALTATSRTSLWQRLSAHRGHLAGSFPGGGNHRGSIFRLHVGEALLGREGRSLPTWGHGSSAPREVRLREHDHERAVSAYIRAMPFLWLDVPDGALPHRPNPRAWIERNVIALLSNADRPPIDPPSPNWLGHHANREEIRRSGLWNVNHVHEKHEPSFVEDLEYLVEKHR